MPDLHLTDNIASKIENRLPICPLHDTGDRIGRDTSRETNDSLEVAAFNPNYYHPIRHHLECIEWSIWGTLTWKDPFRRLDVYEAEKARRLDFKELVKKTRSAVGLRGKEIYYYHATEYGRAGENHLHFLIWNTKPMRVPHLVLAHTMQDYWTKDFELFDGRNYSRGCGTAVIAPYDKGRENRAAQYCFKREFDEYGKERERYDDMSDNLFKHLLRMTNKK